MTKPKQVILVIEDNKNFLDSLKALLEISGKFELLIAEDQTVAWDLFMKNKDRLTAVLMDGSVPGKGRISGFTGWLIQDMRKQGYKGLILGMPGERETIETMKIAGADEVVIKTEIVGLLDQKLGLW